MPRECVKRSACVGASTTVSNHNQDRSWTQLLEHWLNLWAQRHNNPLRYEVLNLGREGITSDDIAAIVRTEALPFSPDFIVYMEGANQFAPDSVVRRDGAEKFRAPPPGLLEAAGGVSREGALQGAASWSALARRISGIGAQTSVLAEPAKPLQRFVLPAGLEETNPDSAIVSERNVLGMRPILADWERIEVESRAAGSQLLLATFPWVVREGMSLHPQRHAEIFNDLNIMTWPLSTAMLCRAVALQQAVFRTWAEAHAVPVLDIAARMPREPDLFIDGIHDNQFGWMARAWCFLEALTPILEAQRLSQRFVKAPALPASMLGPAQRLQLR